MSETNSEPGHKGHPINALADDMLSGERPRIVAVVLNWNAGSMTRECLQSMAAQTLPTKVVVIDNGSTDDSLVRLASAATGCDLVALPENRGFAGGMNLGIRLARERGADYAWVVNNDTVAEPGCLEALVDAMLRHPRVVIAGPRLISEDGTEQHAGGHLDWVTADVGLRRAGDMAGPAEGGRWIIGTAMLIRLASLRYDDAFDPRFFAYWEDVDLSMRVLRDHGDLRAVPGAVTRHLGGQSTGGGNSPVRTFLMSRNEWLLLIKYLVPRAQPGAFMRFAARQLHRAGVLWDVGEYRSAEAAVAGIVAAWRHRWGPPPPLTSTRITRLLAAHPWRLGTVLQWCARGTDLLLAVGQPVRPPERST